MSESSEITYSTEKPEISTEPQMVEGHAEYQFVLQCYDSAGRVHYYSGRFDLEELGRDVIKARLYEKAVAEGCDDCASTFIN